MNTDASNVEDIKIHQIKNVCRCLALHLLKSSPVSFAIDHSPCAKNDRDFNETSDSVAELESTPSSSLTNLSVSWVNDCPPTGLTVLASNTFHQISTLEKTTFRQCSILSSLMSKHPSQVSPFLVAAIQRAQRYFLTLRFGFHRAFRCNRGKHVRIPHAVSRDQIHHRLRFLL